jgi:hypothetical protein
MRNCLRAPWNGWMLSYPKVSLRQVYWRSSSTCSMCVFYLLRSRVQRHESRKGGSRERSWRGRPRPRKLPSVILSEASLARSARLTQSKNPCSFDNTSDMGNLGAVTISRCRGAGIRPKSTSPENSRGLKTWFWTMSVSTYDSAPDCTVKLDSQYSSDLGGLGSRTLVAEQPLECLTDIVQYPLATPSRRCLRRFDCI